MPPTKTKGRTNSIFHPSGTHTKYREEEEEEFK
jgi:hypothetical protein